MQLEDCAVQLYKKTAGESGADLASYLQTDDDQHNDVTDRCVLIHITVLLACSMVEGVKKIKECGKRFLWETYRRAAKRYLPYLGSYNVRHLTRVNARRLNPSQTGPYSIYPPWGDRRQS